MEPSPPDFDQLCARAYAKDSTIDEKHALWRAVFELKEWNFIARGEFPEVNPYVAGNQAIANGEYMLKAFTDAKKLHAFAMANQLTDERGVVQLLSIPVAGFMESVESYRGMGVFGIHFNADAADAGFFAPLPQLTGICNFLKQRDETKT